MKKFRQMLSRVLLLAAPAIFVLVEVAGRGRP